MVAIDDGAEVVMGTGVEMNGVDNGKVRCSRWVEMDGVSDRSFVYA